jgi:glutathione synthase/RimK-type ligase-like ATP-grasp enzyme
MDVALVTCAEWPKLSYSDSFLYRALVERDIDACAYAWNDPAADWSRPLVSVIRSPWDYYRQPEAFLAWAQRVSQLHTLWNPGQLLQWCTHKRYLRDLEERGIPIIPTLWCERGSSVDLAQEMRKRGWSEVVLKPAVSGNGYGTISIKEDTAATEGQLYLDHMSSLQDMLVQPFFSSVLSRGERSIVVIDGKVTHAVVRSPIRGVAQQPDHDAVELPENSLITPLEEEVQLAYKVVDLLPAPTLFARVDVVNDEEGRLHLMEVELVDPRLWLEWVPEAVERFADAIAREVRLVRSKREAMLHVPA